MGLDTTTYADTKVLNVRIANLAMTSSALNALFKALEDADNPRAYPLEGEIIYETDTNRFKVGDGVTKYSELPYSIDIIDNLTTNDSTKILSAKQGKILKDLVDTNKAEADSNNNTQTEALKAHINRTDNPHNVTKTQIGLSDVDNESKVTMFTSPIFTGIPTAPTPTSATNSTQIATTAFVQALLQSSDAMRFKGTVGNGGTIASLPESDYSQGDTWKVASAGIYAGKVCEIGDLIMCVADYSSEFKDDDWTVVQSNIDGAVVGPASSIDNSIPVYNGPTGKVIGTSSFNAVLASENSHGFMDRADKIKIDALPTRTELTSELDEKINKSDYIVFQCTLDS